MTRTESRKLSIGSGRPSIPDQPTAATGDADASFAQLNLAQTTLRDPKARLRHLLELGVSGGPADRPDDVPATLADQFAPIHGLLREIDALLARKAAAPSALTRALLAREEFALRERTEERLTQVEMYATRRTTRPLCLRRRWEERPTDAATRLHELYQRFSYLSRWLEQLRERLFQLGM